MNSLPDYLPILTSIIAFSFALEIYGRYKISRAKYFLWWTIGLINYSLGTFSESMNLLLGWSVFNFKFWYISGAIYGGFTLAQGTVYLLMSERFALVSQTVLLIFSFIALFFIVIAPVEVPEPFDGHLSGDMFVWQWVRWFSPVLNIYSFIFSFGAALYSANEYFNHIHKESRFIACMYIGFGALLPVVGGFYTKLGYQHVLFITEFIGLLFIYYGYRVMRKDEEII